MREGQITQEEATLVAVAERPLCQRRGLSAAALQWYAAQVLRKEIKPPGERENLTVITADAVEAARAVTLDTVFMLEGEKESVHEDQ